MAFSLALHRLTARPWCLPYSPAFPLSFIRSFALSAAQGEKHLPPRIVIPESDLEENFLKGSGPGGIVIKCQATRSRDQNRKTARRVLAEKLEDIERGPESRSAIKAATKARKKASRAKKSRRKYRALDAAKLDGGDEAGTGEVDPPAAAEHNDHVLHPASADNAVRPAAAAPTGPGVECIATQCAA
ncbi:hypothetical protein EJ06DRAFT_551262 [Trichodelitschia bisporula]|uniref:Prokaryotic-type class I peptide chain release factors domain-containing protein n=1 Tax=Trichodelitschia bisporula TaxID=703511 RepID=A0A6G1HMM3_9PEZI|nr:hypothetical protein EJ06DRAFT_551262 [Trichodelitschia bisporula]